MQTIPHAHTLHLDTGRIGAGAGAIALNAVLLLALFAPLSPSIRPQEEREVITVETIPPPPRPVPPPDPVPVPVTQAPRIPEPTPLPPRPLQAAAVDAPAVDPQPGDEPVPVPPAGPVAPEAAGTGAVDTGAPVEGVHLEYASAPPPAYPRDALREGLTGTVLLQVLVDVDGRPLDVTVARSSGHRTLDAAARRQVLAHWRFRPAMRDGRVVQAIGLVPVDFRLD